MTNRVFLPQSQTTLVNQRGVTMQSFYRWFQYIDGAVSTNGDNGNTYADQIKAIALALGSPDGSVSGIPPQGNQAVINGAGSIEVSGTLESGVVNLSLFGDAAYPQNDSYYGTDATGKRGFYTLASEVVTSLDGFKGDVVITNDDPSIVVRNSLNSIYLSVGIIDCGIITAPSMGRITSTGDRRVTSTADHRITA